MNFHEVRKSYILFRTGSRSSLWKVVSRIGFGCSFCPRIGFEFGLGSSFLKGQIRNRIFISVKGWNPNPVTLSPGPQLCQKRRHIYIFKQNKLSDCFATVKLSKIGEKNFANTIQHGPRRKKKRVWRARYKRCPRSQVFGPPMKIQEVPLASATKQDS